MAQKQYRLNLNAATFPVLVGQIGRTAFVRNESQSFIQPSYFAGNEDEKNLGIPQVLSVDNCLPSSRGFQSVFPIADVLSPYICYGKVFDTSVYQAIPVVSSGSSARRLFYFFYENVEHAWDVVGNWFRQLNPGAGEKKKLPFYYTSSKDYWVTYAEIRGQTYIHISRYSVYKPVYNGDNYYNQYFDLQILELDGLSSNMLNGICQGVNYLIAYDDDTIYYSDPSDATKFIPALGGAGSTKLLAVKGVIVACYPIPDGFIVYTTENAVAAIYTGNAQQPFVFKEIPDCPGIVHPRNVGWENSTGDHYVFTKRGLQVVSKNNSKAIFPEVSDMLMHRRRQTLIFDKPYPSNNCVMYVADETDANISMDEFPEVQISYVSSRYVCISYRDNLPTNGPQADRSGPEGSVGFAFTACLVFDTALGRFGKLSYDHSCMLAQSDLINETSKKWYEFTDDLDNWVYDRPRDLSRGEAWSDYYSTEPYLQNIQSPLYCIAPWGAIIRWSADAEQLVHSVQARAMWESDFKSPNNLFTWQPKVVIGRVNLVTDRALNIYEILIEGKFSNVVDPDNPTTKVTDLQIEVFDFKEFPTKAAPIEFLPNTADNVGVSFRGERFVKKLRVVAFDPIIVISGCFNISSICVTVAPGGKR